jgi:hypothetical protein
VLGEAHRGELARQRAGRRGIELRAGRRSRSRLGGGALRPQDRRRPARGGPAPQGTALRRGQRLRAIRLRARPAGSGLHRSAGTSRGPPSCGHGPDVSTCARSVTDSAAWRWDFPGLRDRLRTEGAAALLRTRKEHVPLLYFTGLSWFAAISVSKDDSELTADQSQAEALMRRALALDESYDRGALHDFFISWEGRGESVGGSFAAGPHAPGARGGPGRGQARVRARELRGDGCRWRSRTARSSRDCSGRRSPSTLMPCRT